MDSQLERLILDNPHLTSTVLMSITGLSKRQVLNIKNTGEWIYSGVGIPFMSFINCNERPHYRVHKNRRTIYQGIFSRAVENVDRLIYCLENNNGKLPSKVFDNMEFIGRNS